MDDVDVPDESSDMNLKMHFAHNGYYSRSLDKRQMLEKNMYYENMKDFVDE